MRQPLPSTPVPDARPARRPRVAAWLVAMMVTVEFLQWTVVQDTDVQGLLGFRRADLDLGRWWTSLTFPLVHRDIWVLCLNAYAIALFGARLEVTWGSKRFAAFAVVASIGAWILQLLSGTDGVLLGSSATAFAALGAYAMNWGGDRHGVAGGLEVQGRWLTVIVGTLILLVGLRSGPGGGVAFLTHLGGLGTAWLFVRATPGLLVERIKEGVSALPDEPPEDQPPRAVPKSPPRQRRDRESIDDLVARTNAQAARRAAPRRRAQPDAPPAVPTIDAILDKISAKGIDQLTDEERRVLDDHSKRLRDG